MSSCSKYQKGSKFHPNSVKRAVYFFPKKKKKIARIAQQLEASPPGHHTCHHVQNVKNVQNVIQMALKCLFFSEKIEELPNGWELRLHSGSFFSSTQSSQPTTFKIVITGFLNKQML